MILDPSFARRSLAVALLVLAGCSAAQVASIIQPPRVTGLSPRIAGIDFTGVNLEFDAQVENPLPVPIKTPSFRYEIEIAGRKLAVGRHESGLDLPSSGTGAATLPVRLSFADIFAIASSLSDKQEVDYRLGGSFLVSALGQSWELPLSHSGKLPVLRPPTFSSVRVGKPEFSMGNARFTVNADIGNPNVFPLGIDGMGYEVVIGDIPLGGIRASTGSRIDANGKGGLELTGEVSLIGALFQALSGGQIGEARIRPAGAIETPWGRVAFSGRSLGGK